MERPQWRYSKEEGLHEQALRGGFEWVLSKEDHLEGFRKVHVEEGFAGISLGGGGVFRMEPKVNVFKRERKHERLAKDNTDDLYM